MTQADLQAGSHPPHADHTGHAPDEGQTPPPIFSRRLAQRLAWGLAAVLVVVLLITLPPLVNVNHYQRRVAQSISDSIGRPVHFDEIHVHLLPLPGLTIQNFVVADDPTFSMEPAMRANTVEARLRLASLWRRRVEVSHIQLQAPSINLVRRSDGRWNLQGVINQAGMLQSAPTAQRTAGSAGRFPYIEATEARINVREGENKLPWSLVDAKLALWLHEDNEWRVRMQGRPLRTDTDVSDVGELQVEGSLGRGATGAMNQPLAISARWSSTPLGEAAKLIVGNDTGFRGAASAELEVAGTPAAMRITTDVHLHNLRRADFVPRLPMSINAHCEADGSGVLHALHNVRCAIPTAQSEKLFDAVSLFRGKEEHVMAAPDVIAITADVPNVFDPATATASAELKDGKPGYFLNWLRVFSSRIPESLSVDGTVAFQADYSRPDAVEPALIQRSAPERNISSDWTMRASCSCLLPHGVSPAASGRQSWVVHIERTQQTMAVPGRSIAITAGAVAPQESVTPQPGNQPGTQSGAQPGTQQPRANTQGEAAAAQALSTSIADPSITGHLGRTGYSVAYTSAELAAYAGSFLPTLSDGLPVREAERTGDGRPDVPPATSASPARAVSSQRIWGGPQVWTEPVAAAQQPSRHKRRR